MRRSELRMGVTLIMEWKRILARNGANYCEMVQIGANIYFRIPFNLCTWFLSFHPLTLLFARYSPLRGCSSQTPSQRPKFPGTTCSI